MNRVLRLGAAAVFVTPVFPAAGLAQITPEFQEYLQDRLNRTPAVAFAIGLIDSSGTHYLGLGPREVGGTDRVDEHTVFEIGSVTKTFTGLALARLVVAGEVALDDPVDAYLPDGVEAPERGGKHIALVDLSTHRSGLPRLPFNMRPADGENPYADYTVEMMYEFLSRHELRRDVGASWEYSNLGVGLLGHALARHRGTTYDGLIREQILTPLGMEDTGMERRADQAGRAARGHTGGTVVSDWDIPVLAGAGALRSTVSDMVTYVRAHLDGGSELDEAIALALREHAEANGPGATMGLGWIRRDAGGRYVFWHNGGTGGYASFVGFDPERNRGVVVLSNSTESVDDIGAHLLDPAIPPAQISDRVSVSPEILARYEGQYQLTPQMVLAVRPGSDGIVVQATGQGMIPFTPRSESEFFNTSVGAVIEFLMTDSGDVVGLILTQGGRELQAERIR